MSNCHLCLNLFNVSRIRVWIWFGLVLNGFWSEWTLASNFPFPQQMPPLLKGVQEPLRDQRVISSICQPNAVAFSMVQWNLRTHRFRTIARKDGDKKIISHHGQPPNSSISESKLFSQIINMKKLLKFLHNKYTGLFSTTMLILKFKKTIFKA